MIQLFKPIYDKKLIHKHLDECLDKGWTGAGFKTIEFEERWKEYTGHKHAHFLNSATSGLHLALEIIKLNRGEFWNRSQATILVPGLSFTSTYRAVDMAGAKMRPVDINPKTLCMDSYHLDNQITDQVRAVIYVGMGGTVGELANISDVCKRRNIPLIIDAAHMAGTKHIPEADYTVYSFQAVKNLSCGDGGMLCCKDEYDDKLARKLAWLGISKDTWNRTKDGDNWKYNIEFSGWKYHGNSIAASMGLAGLETLDGGNKIRQLEALEYDSRLLSAITKIRHSSGSSRHLYQIRVDNLIRDKLIKHARDNGVECGVHYQFPSWFMRPIDAPISHQLSKELISLPIGPHLRERDVDRVIEVMNDGFFKCRLA